MVILVDVDSPSTLSFPDLSNKPMKPQTETQCLRLTCSSVIAISSCQVQSISDC